MSKTLQNFYKSTVTIDWTIGTGNFYVSVKPTVSNGWLVISPNNTSIREIVAYTATGTDGNGDYVTVSARGVGGTSEQIHSIGEPVRMNITAEYWADMVNDIANIVAAGVTDATTTAMGGVELATSAELIAGTDVSGAGHPLVAQPSLINTRINALLNATLPTVTIFTASGTYTKPAGLKYAVVEVQGAGGNGVTAGGNGAAGGGGGAYSKKAILATSIGTTETVTVGGGGTGSGNTSFGSLLVASNAANGSTTTGGAGGTASGGDVNISGGAGQGVAAGTNTAGAGGSSYLGKGGAGGAGGTVGTSNSNDGQNGQGYGGGGGASLSASDGNPTGTAGTGAGGIVIVTNYF